jgi:hypothetical protein
MEVAVLRNHTVCATRTAADDQATVERSGFSSHLPEAGTFYNPAHLLAIGAPDFRAEQGCGLTKTARGGVVEQCNPYSMAHGGSKGETLEPSASHHRDDIGVFWFCEHFQAIVIVHSLWVMHNMNANMMMH